MPSTVGRLARPLSILVLALAVSDCAGGAAASSPSPPAPTPSPTATPDFSISVSPPEQPIEIRLVIPGVPSSFLVAVTDPAGSAGDVVIAATAKGVTITDIVPPTASKPVAEVWFVAGPVSDETDASITITATRGTVTKTELRSVRIFPMEDGRAADAAPYFQHWITWLAAEHPELGITASTKWEPRFVSTLLVVSHYAYYSDEWELTLAWHNMIPPSDWTEIHLRRRGVDLAPTLAFRQDSVKGATEPHPATAPTVVVR
jgi:hypothetical protein